MSERWLRKPACSIMPPTSTLVIPRPNHCFCAVVSDTRFACSHHHHVARPAVADTCQVLFLPTRYDTQPGSAGRSCANRLCQRP
jgi:hypothetical protein